MNEQPSDQQNVGAIRWDRDADGVVTLTVDEPGRSTNTLTTAFQAELRAVVDRLRAEAGSGLTGVVLTSAKSTFFAGGDLHELLEFGPADAERLFAAALDFKRTLRDLECLGVPVVTALNGAALGGGLEIALATHHRIAVRDRRAEFGLPEVTLGLLPGGGGVVRTVRLLGLQKALSEVLLDGQRRSADEALALGLVDEVVDAGENLIARAKDWIRDHPDASQPWDRPGFTLPEPAGTPDLAMLPVLTAQLRKRTRGAPAPAAHNILAAAVEGANADIDVAGRIESRYFVELVTGQIAKNLISARFLEPQAVRAGKSRPVGPAPWRATRVAVVGAGMMGAGIAYQCALRGLDVVLKDTSQETAERGRSYSVGLLDKAVASGRRSPAERDEVLARIRATDRLEDCAGADIVIEAVFEDEQLKHRIYKELQDLVGPETLLASNTSTIPITDLAIPVERPERFVGMHFFSPVDRMPLLEIIRGARSSDETIARAFDFALQIGKTPIVVNDSRGFFTSRVIGTVVNEGVMMLGEGIDPVTIERAATMSGYPVGMLQLTDEINMELSVKIFAEARQTAEAAGRHYVPHPAELIIEEMVALGRPGRLRGAGFYDYGPDGRRTGLWPDLSAQFSAQRTEIPFPDLQERMLFVEAIDSVRCLQEGVLTTATDGNVGSILGIGYPAWTGGVLQYVNQYAGGPAGFLARAEELAERYGERFVPPALLRDKVAAGERFD